MNIDPHQFVASIVIAICILALIIRLVQKGNLDIAYSWLWLAIAAGMLIVVIRYDWLESLSRILGSKTQTTTLFLMAIIIVMLLCLQFSLVVSSQRRQIKRLTQELAMLANALEQRISAGGKGEPDITSTQARATREKQRLAGPAEDSNPAR